MLFGFPLEDLTVVALGDPHRLGLFLSYSLGTSSDYGFYWARVCHSAAAESLPAVAGGSLESLTKIARIHLSIPRINGATNSLEKLVTTR